MTRLAWKRNAAALAAWARERLVNRDDVWGGYWANDEGVISPTTRPTKRDRGRVRLREADLRRHFEAASCGDVVGLHAASAGPHATSRWFLIDIDCHEDDDDPEANLRAGLHWVEVLTAFDIRPLLTTSNGRGGYHLRVIFSSPIPVADAYRLSRWLVRDHADFGLAAAPECFPKQAAIGAPGEHGEFGNWARLPGRHHKRNHWAEAWDVAGERWCADDDAIAVMLACTGDDATRLYEAAGEWGRDVPAASAPIRIDDERDESDARSSAPPAGNAGGGGARVADRFNRAARWADLLPGWREDSRKDGVTYLTRPGKDSGVSATLGSCKGDGFDLLHVFTSNAPPFRSGGTYSPFGAFGLLRHKGDYRAATLALVGMGYGDERPTPSRASSPPPPSAPEQDAPEQEDGVVSGEEVDGNAGGERPTILTNFRWQETEQDGKKTVVKVGLHACQIQRCLEGATGGWPRRIGKHLFQHADQNAEPSWMTEKEDLFAWASRHFGEAEYGIHWAVGGSLISKAEFFSNLRQCARDYDAMESVPHFPPRPRTYYAHRDLPVGDGLHLDALVARFRPATPLDRELIAGFFATLFWGGEPGSRPAFLITGPDADELGGRGVGKSWLAMLAAELVGGFLSISTNDPIPKTVTRLLSPEGRGKRMVLLDNLKSLRFSWDELEGFITSSTISGHDLFKGEGKRPNTTVFVITINGCSLSRDIAQRVIPIKLARPVYDPDWLSRTRAFINEHRWQIIADVKRFFDRPPQRVRTCSRWNEWDREVLARLADPDAIAAEIGARQGTMDSDSEEKDHVRETFREQLRLRHHNPDFGVVFIPTATASEWVTIATGEKRPTQRATAYLMTLNLSELRKSWRDSKRGWTWRGPDSNQNESSVLLNSVNYMPA